MPQDPISVPAVVGGRQNTGLFTQHIDIPASTGQKGISNPPTIRDLGDAQVADMTVDTDELFVHALKRQDWATGDLSIHIEWTNDGGEDDQNKYVKFQCTYTACDEGDDISSSTATLTVVDQYTSASGNIMCKSGDMTIPEASLLLGDDVHAKIMCIDASGSGDVLTCEPSIIAVHFEYTAKNLI